MIRAIVIWILLGIGCLSFQTAMAQSVLGDGLTTTTAVLAHAEPDECFSGIGENSLGVSPPCAEGSQEKVNEGYVWGMALAGDKIFFGTVANTQCLVIGSFLQSTDPTINDAYVCEFGQSPVPGVPAALGDYRPPHLYMYDQSTESLTDLVSAMSSGARTLLSSTVGIRAAGAYDGVVLFGGLSLTGGVNFFAFSDDGTFLTAGNESAYSNIRKFRAIQGALYVGVGYEAGGLQEGRILKWTGNSSDPISFETVGIVDSEVAELALHDGRLFVTTWPDDDAEAALYMSPPLPMGGSLQTSDANNWVSVFSVSDYEVNPISAATYGLGALASFDGWLFWGTMHVPGTGVAAHESALDEGIGFDLDDVLLSERSISIFRGRDFATTREIDVLYGYPEMPVLNVTNGDWTYESNNLGQDPIFGAPGFNNLLNNYTWAMEVYDDRLWVGTMDVGGLIAYGAGALTADLGGVEGALIDVISATAIGADLWFFASANVPAFPESLNGAGNPANYGFRTMASDGERLIVGTANPMNLLTDNETRSQGIGGWELLAIDALDANTPVGENVQVELGDGVMVEFCSVTGEGITGAATFGDSDAEAILLGALNAELNGGNAAEEGSVLINSTYTMATSALWSSEGCTGNAVTMNLTFDTPLYNARLVRVIVDPNDGGLIIDEIPAETWPLGDDPALFGFSSGISADLSQDLLGFIVLLSDRPPVPVPSSLWFALVLLAGLIWGSVLRRY